VGDDHLHANFSNLREAKENKFPGSLKFKEEMLSFKMISLTIAEYKELLEISLSHSTYQHKLPCHCQCIPEGRNICMTHGCSHTLQDGGTEKGLSNIHLCLKAKGKSQILSIFIMSRNINHD